jgi:hypothetical protein
MPSELSRVISSLDVLCTSDLVCNEVTSDRHVHYSLLHDNSGWLIEQDIGHKMNTIISIFFRVYWEPSLAFEAFMDPVDASAQAALAPHQTTEQKESAGTTFMAM